MDKAPDAFRTISEVADEIDVPQHVLRFWESRFAQIRPMKRGGGRRYYRRDDVDLLRGVRHLLYGEGYTIRGVQRILREQGAGFVQNVWRAGAEPPPPPAPEDSVEDEAAARPAMPGPAAPSVPATTERTEPDLSLFSFAGRGANAAGGEPDAERPAPVLAVAAVRAKAKPIGLGAERRSRLNAALDELVACHRRIEAALVDQGFSDLSGSRADQG